MLKYQFFPRSVGISEEIKNVVKCFELVYDEIKSPENNLDSDGVLKKISPYLQALNFQVEISKKKEDKIPVPVLFGLNNKIDKYFSADALSADGKIVLEVEAGRAVVNYQFLKDIFQACMMYGVEYLIIAVRNDYQKKDDFQKVCVFLETLYISNRLSLPLKGILIIGY
jgi:hypothetical protein